MPQARTRNPEEKGRLLLAAARSLFIEQGFDATTTRQIADRSGVSQGILYHQFESKVGLLAELARDFSESGATELLPEHINLDAIEPMVRKVIAFIDSDRALFGLLRDNEVLLSANEVPTLRDVLIPLIETRLRERKVTGANEGRNPRFMARVLFGIMQITINQWNLARSRKEKEAIVLEGVRCLKAVYR